VDAQREPLDVHRYTYLPKGVLFSVNNVSSSRISASLGPSVATSRLSWPYPACYDFARPGIQQRVLDVCMSTRQRVIYVDCA